MVVRDQGFQLGTLEFGNDSNMGVVVESFTPSSATPRNPSVEAPRSDARWFGRSHKTPATWTWSLFINRTDEKGALETLGLLEDAWDVEQTRLAPGEVVALQYRVGGRTRRVYGRPVRCEPILDVRRLQGYIAVEATFDRADALHYDEIGRSISIIGFASTTGGIVAPIITPITTLRVSTPREGQAIVEGSAPTWAVVEFHATNGATNPRVRFGGVEIKLDGSIAPGEVVTVDPRPWARTVLNANGASRAGLLRGSPMEDMKLPVGVQQVLFDAVDPTGTAKTKVRWRPASRSL